MTDEGVDEALTVALAAVAGALITEKGLVRDLERIVKLAAHVVPRCSSGSVALLVEGAPRSVAVTDSVAMEVDLVQYQTAEGPCLTALGGAVVRVGFVPHDQRFPHFAIGAADQRVLSVLSTPLRTDGTVVGTLNLYSNESEAFDGSAEHLALVFAAEAAIVVVQSAVYRQARETRQAIQDVHEASTEIARAEGVLVGNYECSQQQARILLQQSADEQDDRLVDAARRILAEAEARIHDIDDLD